MKRLGEIGLIKKDKNSDKCVQYLFIKITVQYNKCFNFAHSKGKKRLRDKFN